jgi:hypothetical protein
MTDHVIQLIQLNNYVRISDDNANLSNKKYNFLTARWFKNSPYHPDEPGVFIQPMRMIGSDSKNNEYIYAFANGYNYEIRDVPLVEVDSLLRDMCDEMKYKEIIMGRF